MTPPVRPNTPALDDFGTAHGVLQRYTVSAPPSNDLIDSALAVYRSEVTALKTAAPDAFTEEDRAMLQAAVDAVPQSEVDAAEAYMSAVFEYAKSHGGNEQAADGGIEKDPIVRDDPAPAPAIPLGLPLGMPATHDRLSTPGSSEPGFQPPAAPAAVVEDVHPSVHLGRLHFLIDKLHPLLPVAQTWIAAEMRTILGALGASAEEVAIAAIEAKLGARPNVSRVR